MRKITKYLSNHIPAILSLVVILISVYLLIFNMRVNQGMWIIFDDVHVVRTQEMAFELKSGQFPVRLLSRLGHGAGYMLFNFYSPLVYYLTSTLTLIGINPLNAVKLAFQLCYLLAATGMFALLNNLFPKKPTLHVLGSLLLIGSTYFNYDAYTRGALAELFGFSLIPWLFFAYQKTKREKNWIWVILLAIISSVIIYTHAITAFIVAPFIALHLIIDTVKQKIPSKTVFKFVIAGILAVGLSASYVIPMWAEKPLVIYNQVDYVTNASQNFISLKEILGLTRSEDRSIKPNTIGLPLTIFCGLGLVLNWWKSRKKTDKNEILFISISLGLILFLQLSVSTWLWQHFEIIRMVQFPYRYQTLFTVIAILAGIYGLSFLKTKLMIIVACLILIYSTYINREFATPSGYYFASDYQAEDPCGTTTWQHEYLTKWTARCIEADTRAPLATSSGELVISEIVSDQRNAIKITTNGKSGKLILGKYYFPGWVINTPNRELATSPYGQSGLVSVNLEEGENLVYATFNNTRARIIGNAVTLLSLIASITLSLITMIKRNKT